MLDCLDVILNSISDDRFFMIPSLILMFFWLGAIITEFFGKRLCRQPSSHLIFPIGFLVLALYRITTCFCVCLLILEKHLEHPGTLDLAILVQDAWIVARSLIWMTSLAILSLLSSIVVMFCRGKTKN